MDPWTQSAELRLILGAWGFIGVAEPPRDGAGGSPKAVAKLGLSSGHPSLFNSQGWIVETTPEWSTAA